MTPMPQQFTNRIPPPIEGSMQQGSQNLPHGLLTPPAEVRERLDRDKAKFAPEVYTRDVEERVLNDWTLQYYFGNGGYYEVLYRQTPQGPEVLAVGDDEILEYTKKLPVEEQRKLETWLP